MAPAIAYTLPAMQLVCNLVMPGISSGNYTFTGAAPNQLIPQAQTAVLPEGYVAYHDLGVAYKISNSETTWQTARRRCVEEGSHLAIIDTPLKLEYVMSQSDPAEKLHVGIHGMSGNAVWVSVADGSTITNLPWANMEPSGASDIVIASREPRGLRNLSIDDTGLAVCELPIPQDRNSPVGLPADISAD